MKNYRFASLILILLFSFSLNIYADGYGWTDNSEELPGMMSDGEVIALAVGTGLVLTGLITYVIIKKKQDKALSSHSPGIKSTNSLGLSLIEEPTSFYTEINKAAEQSPVQIITSFNEIPMQNSSYVGMSVGVRIKF